MPRRIAVTGMQGVDATVIVTAVHGTVWLSISPPFTWEAIMTPGKVDEVIHPLELARDEARMAAATNNGSTPLTATVTRAITSGRTGEPCTTREVQIQIQPLPVELGTPHPPRRAQSQRRGEQPQLIHTL
jgi:hypothetical protein